MNWYSFFEGFLPLMSQPFIQLMVVLFLLAIVVGLLSSRRSPGRSRRYRSRKWTEFVETLRKLVFWFVFLVSPTILAWFDERPWAKPLAIFITVTGLLGLVAFLVTWQQTRRQENQRRLLTLDSWQNLSASGFEEFVAALFRTQGYKATVTGRTADGGIDIRLEKNGTHAVAQCKRYLTGKKVGVKDVREFTAVLSRSGAAEGYFVTSSAFTNAALNWAKREPIRLIDSEELIEWMNEARQGVYAQPIHHPLFFSSGQWLTISLLGMTLVGVFGFGLAVFMWG